MSTTGNELFDYIIDNVDSPKWNPRSRYLDCKCPICDANTSKKHGHFHIYLNDNQPIFYSCFRASCGVKGVLNRKMAMQLGLTNPAFLKVIQNSFNSNIMIDSSKNFRYKGLSNIDLGELDDVTCDYFKMRTGRVLTKDLQKRFRICCSINEFVRNNSNQEKLDFESLEYLQYKENVLNKKYIYFFNDTYTMLYGRQINGDEKIKLSIIKSSNPLLRHSFFMFRGDGSRKFSEGDSEDTLFLAEGIFDIINAYFHVYKDYSGIFMASTAFTSTYNCITVVSKEIYKPDIVILSDDDVHINIYTRSILRRLNKKRLGDMYVVYNKEGKDLGEYQKKPFKLDITKIFSRKG